MLKAVPKTMNIQKAHTNVQIENGVPRAKSAHGTALNFAQLAKDVAIDSSAGVHEQQAWNLLAILFDEDDEVPNDLDEELLTKNKKRFRKDKLSDFWQSLVHQDAERHAQQSESPEERAIAYLSGHNIAEACHALLNNMDLRLATMVSQIGGDETMRTAMTEQLDEWRRKDVISEMEDSIRALYELLAGNCAQSDGSTKAGKENRAAKFTIAERFNLDWRRAFGLRLWYGTLVNEPIEMAVAQFADALRDKKEHVKPVPWFHEQDVDMGWRDASPDTREDLLWGILKLYASTKMEVPANIEDVLSPENVSGHPLNARLSFQLYSLFKARQDDPREPKDRKVGMPTVRHSDDTKFRQSFMSNTSAYENDEQADDALAELGDKLALTYAASLHTPEHWTTAAFAYTYLTSPALREHYIRSSISQYIHTFNVDENDEVYKYLSEELRIPTEWIHSAAAVKAKSEGDDVRQALHLIKARDFEEAHQVLCRSVGPECVISRQHDALREILGEIMDAPNNSPVADNASVASHGRRRKQELVHGWKRGGELYYDYIHLKDCMRRQSSYRVDEELDKEITAVLSKLQKALEDVAKDSWKGRGLEERVALTEIASEVAGMIAKNDVSDFIPSPSSSGLTASQHIDRSHVLKLPLTEDQWLRHSIDLSIGYYQAVIASGK